GACAGPNRGSPWQRGRGPEARGGRQSDPRQRHESRSETVLAVSDRVRGVIYQRLQDGDCGSQPGRPEGSVLSGFARPGLREVGRCVRRYTVLSQDSRRKAAQPRDGLRPTHGQAKARDELATNTLDGVGEPTHSLAIFGGLRVRLDLPGEFLQVAPLLRVVRVLGLVQLSTNSRDTVGREAAAALELIEIRPRDDEGRRPDDLRLVRRIGRADLHQLGRVDLILRQILTRLEVEYIQPPRDL